MYVNLKLIIWDVIVHTSAEFIQQFRFRHGADWRICHLYFVTQFISLLLSTPGLNMMFEATTITIIAY